MNRKTVEQTGIRSDRKLDSQTDGLKVIQMDKPTVIWTGSQTDIERDRETDSKTDRHRTDGQTERRRTDRPMKCQAK